MSMRQSHTAVVERNQRWEDNFVTEPYEASWSHEAIFFLHILRAEPAKPPSSITIEVQVQISPDGIHWCDEGSRMNFDIQQQALDKPSFVRMSHYGSWLRPAGTVKGGRVWAFVHLVLKA